MKLFRKLAGGLALLTVFTLTSCEKEQIELNVVQVNGLTVTLVPAEGGEAKSFTMSTPYTSEDGRTYGELKREDIVLQANTTYNATVSFFSDKAGTRTIQNESIRRDEGVYTVKYKKSSQGNDTQAELNIAVADKKANGAPLGLSATFTTGEAGAEMLYINLDAQKREGKSSMAGTVFNASFFLVVQN